MKCPICGKQMEDGGLWVDGTLVRWVPMETYTRKGIKRMTLPGNKVIRTEATNFLIKQTKVPNAAYCQACNKVIGIFEIDEKYGKNI